MGQQRCLYILKLPKRSGRDDQLKERIQLEALLSTINPLADDIKGAYWFSTLKEIRNAYFDDSILGWGKTGNH